MTTLGEPKEHPMYAGTTTIHRHNGDPHNGDRHVPSLHPAQPPHAGLEDLAAAAAAAAPRPPEQRRRTGRRVGLILAVIGVAAAGAAAAGAWPRLRVHAALAETTQRIDQGRRSVTVVSPSPAKALAEVRLPGSTSALQETVIYARTSGYIASLKVDIGDRVKAGQLLATIASPDVDQQLNEARARREEGYANLALSQSRLKRTREITATGAASAQELDDAQAVYNTQLAAQRVSDNVVARLETDQSYQKVVAPFDGVVTKRNIELGSLIT